MELHGTVIKVKPERLREYKELHAAVWPQGLEATKEYDLCNYSIYYRNGYLFSYYEYTSQDY